jgi:hypothetical protein
VSDVTELTLDALQMKSVQVQSVPVKVSRRCRQQPAEWLMSIGGCQRRSLPFKRGLHRKQPQRVGAACSTGTQPLHMDTKQQ